MKLAPIQLEGYFLTEVNCQVNPQFKADKETKFAERDLEVGTGIHPIKGRPNRWQVSLNIKLQPSAEANSPYSFGMNLIGVVCWVGPEQPEDKIGTLLRTNGPSMLYGVAREMGRDLTARGPFPPLVLPSVSFIPDAPGVGHTPEQKQIAAASSEPSAPQEQH